MYRLLPRSSKTVFFVTFFALSAVITHIRFSLPCHSKTRVGSEWQRQQPDSNIRQKVFHPKLTAKYSRACTESAANLKVFHPKLTAKYSRKRLVFSYTLTAKEGRLSAFESFAKTSVSYSHSHALLAIGI